MASHGLPASSGAEADVAGSTLKLLNLKPLCLDSGVMRLPETPPTFAEDTTFATWMFAHHGCPTMPDAQAQS